MMPRSWSVAACETSVLAWPAIVTFPNAETLPKQLCDALCGGGLVDARSGLIFLDSIDAGRDQLMRAISSRTAIGDSLIGPLTALAEQRGWLTACVDLSGRIDVDPSVCVADAVRSSMNQGAVASRSALRRFFSGGWAIHLGRSACASQGHPTLTSLISSWYSAVRRPLLLILHKPQGALATNEGRNMLTGLRAALDRINLAEVPPRLMVLLNAVDMNSLPGLGTHSRAPFFGAAVVAHGTTSSLDGIGQAGRYTSVDERWHHCARRNG